MTDGDGPDEETVEENPREEAVDDGPDGETVDDGPESDDGDDSPEPLGGLRDRAVDDEESSLPVEFPDEASEGGPARAGADAVVEDDPAGEDDGKRAGADFDDDGFSGDREGPLGEVAAGVDERRRRKSPADDELFESMDVEDVDSDALWEQVEREEPTVEGPRQRKMREIDKHKYCQKCPHFSKPPDVHCTHEGTEIRKQVDVETFEVADCPIVLEDERLEDVTTD